MAIVFEKCNSDVKCRETISPSRRLTGGPPISPSLTTYEISAARTRFFATMTNRRSERPPGGRELNPQRDQRRAPRQPAPPRAGRWAVASMCRQRRTPRAHEPPSGETSRVTSSSRSHCCRAVSFWIAIGVRHLVARQRDAARRSNRRCDHPQGRSSRAFGR